MPKVKVPRKNIMLDMTAMCDVAFLLLTFFMLTTKFKPEEAVVVDIPSSISEKKLSETDLMTISVNKEGAVFFGVDGQNARKSMLERISNKYNLSFTEEEIAEFTLMPSFGTPVASLKSVIQTKGEKRNKIQQGIPVDSLNNELKDWVLMARVSNDKPYTIAVKGDKDADYDVIAKVIATLQEQKINKFNLITNLELRPN